MVARHLVYDDRKYRKYDGSAIEWIKDEGQRTNEQLSAKNPRTSSSS